MDLEFRMRDLSRIQGVGLNLGSGDLGFGLGFRALGVVVLRNVPSLEALGKQIPPTELK